MSMRVAQHRQSKLCLANTLATHVFRFRYEFRVYLHWSGRGRVALLLCHQSGLNMDVMPSWARSRDANDCCQSVQIVNKALKLYVCYLEV